MFVNKRSIGINVDPAGGVLARVWAPNAKTLALRVCNGRIDLPMQREERGYWTLQTDLLADADLYRIVIDNKKFLPDVTSLGQPKGVHEASQVVDLDRFAWTDAKWGNLPLEDYIFYELHTGTFNTEGTFTGIETKLDYLKELGINAIEIMPVAQFCGQRNWGYDGVYPFAVQENYGGAKCLQHLVNTCHEKGLAVVLDVVYNHIGPEGNYFNDYGPYFTEKYHTPWGNAINFDDAGCDAVREYFIQNVLMWFRDFHIDALRLDAVHAIKDFGPKHILAKIRENVNELNKQTGRNHYLIVECDLNDPRFIDPLNKAGFDMDAQWIDEFHHALRVTAGGERTGYYEDFNGIEDLAGAYRNAYVYNGQYSAHRDKNFGAAVNNAAGKQFIAFSQNHDQVGNRMLGERSARLFSFEMQKLMAAAVMTAPYLPMLFMGEEYGETNPFLYFVNHTDPELAEAVKNGRKAEFEVFHAKGEAPDPNIEETFLRSKLQWGLITQEPHQTLLAYYKKLIGLRKLMPALKHLNRKQLRVDVDAENNLLTLHRWHEGDYALVIMNFSHKIQQLILPQTDRNWIIQLDSASSKWRGPKDAAGRLKGNTAVDLQPQSVLIYALQ